MLKGQGYVTGMVGKWHLGSDRAFLPVQQGFNEWLGLPYSNDMWPYHPEAKKGTYPLLPLFDGDKVIDAEVTPEEQAALPKRYAERAVDFIRRSKDRPFFLYFAPNMPHVPLYVGDSFRGKTERGLFGDVISEIDWSVGEVLRTLDELGLSENTMVIFSSDNGPWLSYGEHAGSAGSLREGKGTSWEGGIRVPCAMRWPGRIPPGTVCDEPLMTIDLLPTIARISGAELPKVTLDGRDAWPLLAGDKDAASPHAAYFIYYANNQLQAAISGKWKLVFPHTYRTLSNQEPAKDGIPVKYRDVKVEKTELYDLVSDVGEKSDVSAANPGVVARISKLADEMRADLGDSLTGQKISGLRPAGRLSGPTSK
jgi:arylsulfatase A-like enzyme